MGYKTETYRHRQHCGHYQREGGGEPAVKYVVTEDDLTLGGRHAVQYTIMYHRILHFKLT